MLTYDKNDGAIDWDKSGRRIAFESSYEGKRGVYFIDLFNLPITFSRNGFHSAKYVNQMDNLSNIYVPVAANSDTIFSSPKWDLKGMRILTIGEKNNYNELYVTNRNTLKPIATGIKDVVVANWKNDSVLYIVKKKHPKKLLEINRFSGKQNLVVETEKSIIGISKQLNELYLSCDGGVYDYSSTNNALEWFSLPIKGATTARLGRLNFLGLTKEGSAAVLDLNNAQTYPFTVGENDGSPAISNDEKFVAFYSSYINGIIVKRIDKKFFLE